jgi:hypothetical protein
MLFFLLKVNNPSVRHPVWPLSGTPSGPRLASHLAPIWHPVWPPSGPSSGPPCGTLFGPRRATVGHPIWPPSDTPSGTRLAPVGHIFRFSVFGFQSPRSPSSAGFAGEAARRRRFFRPSSPSHPSKLYSSSWVDELQSS